VRILLIEDDRTSRASCRADSVAHTVRLPLRFRSPAPPPRRRRRGARPRPAGHRRRRSAAGAAAVRQCRSIVLTARSTEGAWCWAAVGRTIRRQTTSMIEFDARLRASPGAGVHRAFFDDGRPLDVRSADVVVRHGGRRDRVGDTTAPHAHELASYPAGDNADSAVSREMLDGGCGERASARLTARGRPHGPAAKKLDGTPSCRHPGSASGGNVVDARGPATAMKRRLPARFVGIVEVGARARVPLLLLVSYDRTSTFNLNRSASSTGSRVRDGERRRLVVGAARRRALRPVVRRGRAHIDAAGVVRASAAMRIDDPTWGPLSRGWRPVFAAPSVVGGPGAPTRRLARPIGS